MVAKVELLDPVGPLRREVGVSRTVFASRGRSRARWCRRRWSWGGSSWRSWRGRWCWLGSRRCCFGLSHTIAHRCIQTSALQSTHAHTCRSSQPSFLAMSPGPPLFRTPRPHSACSLPTHSCSSAYILKIARLAWAGSRGAGRSRVRAGFLDRRLGRRRRLGIFGQW